MLTPINLEVIIKRKLLNDERLLKRTIKRLLLLEHEPEEASRYAGGEGRIIAPFPTI